MTNKKTVVLGASPKPHRYAYKAAHMLREHNHPVVEIDRNTAQLPQNEDIDTVTVYLNERNQQMYHEPLLALQPKRVIFNPGAENPALAQKLKDKGVEVVNACTLVMLATKQF